MSFFLKLLMNDFLPENGFVLCNHCSISVVLHPKPFEVVMSAYTVSAPISFLLVSAQLSKGRAQFTPWTHNAKLALFSFPSDRRELVFNIWLNSLLLVIQPRNIPLEKQIYYAQK